MTVTKHVLVVEDDLDLAKMVCRMLGHDGYAVASVTDGEAALEHIATHPVDLLITDLMMPGMEGEELLLELRRRHDRLPVILLSASAVREQVAEEAVLEEGGERVRRAAGAEAAHAERLERARGVGGLGRSDPPTTTLEERLNFAQIKGNRLFIPALIVPLVAVAGTLLYNYTPLGDTGVFEERRETLILFGIGVLIALGVAIAWLKPPLLAPAEEGRRLLDSIGWAAILPQMLAALGAVFALAGVGDIIDSLAGAVIPEGSVLLTVIVFCLGMAIFTMIMGNAFAAFPVMAAAIGIPLLVEGYGGNPAVIGAVGMLAGFCGTLLTPMAANFNIVPAALLELDDQNGVIKQQVWTAIPLWVCNVAIIYIGAFLLWGG